MVRVVKFNMSDRKTDQTIMKRRRGRPALSREKKLAMRQEIASITLELFQAEGYRNISMRKIATKVGCSAMTLYKYYDSKLAILHTLWDVVFDQLQETMESLTESSLNNVAASYVNYWIQYPENYRLVFMTESVEQHDVDVFLETPSMNDRYSVFVEAISSASERSLTEVEVSEKLGSLICFLNGIAHNHITISGYPWPAPEALCALAVKAILDN